MPGSEPSPASRSRSRKAGTESPSVAAPCETSSGEKACTCMPRHFGFHRAQQGEIGLAGVVRIDAALHADFGRAALPGLAGAARDLLERKIVRPRRAIGGSALPLEKAQKPHLISADIGVVDVAVDDIAHHVAAFPGGARRSAAAQTVVDIAAARENSLTISSLRQSVACTRRARSDGRWRLMRVWTCSERAAAS